MTSSGGWQRKGKPVKASEAFQVNVRWARSIKADKARELAEAERDDWSGGNQKDDQ